jgi:transposase
LVAQVTSANTNDITPLPALVESIPPVRGKRGRPRRRPACLQGDKAYDSNPHRRWLRARRIKPLLGRRRTPHGCGLGRYRWVVERTLSWLHQFTRLRTRYERRDDIHQAFLSLGCALICWRFVQRSLC